MACHKAEVLWKWMHTPMWFGTFPSYHILTQSEAKVEKQISRLYFSSCKFGNLRMQIRIKLKELPQPPQFGTQVVYQDLFKLFAEYLPLLLAIQHYHLTKCNESATASCLLTTFPPLFYGFDDNKVSTKQIDAKRQHTLNCIALELVLLLWSMGQLHALHAESQIMQEDELLDAPRFRQAEIAWQRAEFFYHWAASYSFKKIGHCDISVMLREPFSQLLDSVAISSAILARLCSTQRLSTHFSGLTRTETRPGQLYQIGSVLARRALTLLREANSYQFKQNASKLYDQLKWCRNAYEIRWRAIYYQNELAIYRSNANPEIAMIFCENILKLRIATSSSLCCTQLVHNIQEKHRMHLTQALDEKKLLLNNYCKHFRTKWVFQRLDKCLSIDLVTAREVGPVFSKERRLPEEKFIEEKESFYMSFELVKTIIANVERTILRVKANDTESDTPERLRVSFAKTIQEREVLLAYQKDIKKGEKTRNQSKSKFQEAKIFAACGQIGGIVANATPQDSDRMLTNCEGKKLHVENTIDPPRANEAANIRVTAPSNQVEHVNIVNSTTRRKSKSWLSSYPSCYLTSKEAVQLYGHLYHKKMWRASCALCEQRYMRSNLAGEIVMKRVYELRRKWGVIQKSPKYGIPSVYHGTANVCLQCLEILTHEEAEHAYGESAVVKVGTTTNTTIKDAELTRIIHDSILYQWHQHPPNCISYNNLEDIAVNKRAYQSSTFYSMRAQNALNSDPNRSAHTKEEFQPWWEIDLANYAEVQLVRICLRDELSHLYCASKGDPSPHSYPLHISLSMKSGVGHDCDDVIAKCVTFKSVIEESGPLIEFVIPQNSRGRFVRVQCAGRAVLHIERVRVFVSKFASDLVLRRQKFRQKFQRAAYCASILAKTTATGSNKIVVSTELASKKTGSAKEVHDVESTSDQITMNKSSNDADFDSGRAEKKRIANLYTRFKNLLDARAKYIASEQETNEGTMKAGECDEGERNNVR